MRIWIVNPYALPPSENGGTRHYSIARELINRGNEVYIISSNIHYLTRKRMPGHSGEEKYDGVHFVWVESSEYKGNSVSRLWNNYLFTYRLRFSNRFKTLPKPDVILGSSPHPFGCWAAQRLSKRYHVPFIFEVRDLWPQSLIDLAGVSPKNPIIRLFAYLEKYLYKHADSIITLLPYASDYMKILGVSQNKIKWIPNGIDLNLIPEIHQPSQDHVFKVFYIGSHGIGDGLDLLLDAAHVLNEDKEALLINITLIGNGQEKERLKAKAGFLNLNNVFFEDPVPKSEIYHRIAEADAFVILAINNNLYKWGLSFNKFYDYMAMARPIIFVGSVKSNPVEEYSMGVIIPSLDAIDLAMGIKRLSKVDESQKHQMGLEGRKYVEEKHDYAQISGKLEQVLLEVIEKHKQ